jgi:glycosyltransferase involved in cell wall biosynthesis
MTDKKRLTLVGPIAQPNQPAVGGYESANLRLLSLLGRICPGTRSLAYPRAEGTQIRKALLYAFGFTEILWKLLSGSGRDAAVHFTPLCRHFLAAELLVALAARMRGNRLTVDLRAGMQENWYHHSSMFYRWSFRRLLALATTITYEGEAYARWLATVAPSSRRFWLPNFVPYHMAQRRPRCALPDAPTIIYVGTVSRAKGVEASLHAFRLVRQKLPGAKFVIVGRCDPSFREALDRGKLVGLDVEFTGPLPPPAVEMRLDEAHFFLFLSHWFGEGHSNALTEAMARGCVPFVSNHGFNSAVVGCPELVVDDADATEAIATRITSMWERDRWFSFSDAAVQRVKENFTEEMVLQTLRTVYPDATDVSRAGKRLNLDHSERCDA